MVKPEVKELLVKVFDSLKIKHSVLIEDVGALVKKQIALNSKIDPESKLEDFDYGKYHKLDEINSWMNNIENEFPKLVTIFNVSRSYQQRDIRAMKISVPNASNKKAIWFDGGIHAREW